MRPATLKGHTGQLALQANRLWLYVKLEQLPVVLIATSAKSLTCYLPDVEKQNSAERICVSPSKPLALPFTYA